MTLKHIRKSIFKKMRNNFLILGNGADINELDFNKVDNKLITGGVNRIHFKYIPEYYYIYYTSYADHSHGSRSTSASGGHKHAIQSMNQSHSHTHQYSATNFGSIKINGQEYKCNHASVNMLIRILNKYLYERDDNYFYICGVPLLERVGHFYGEEIKQMVNILILKVLEEERVVITDMDHLIQQQVLLIHIRLLEVIISMDHLIQQLHQAMHILEEQVIIHQQDQYQRV